MVNNGSPGWKNQFFRAFFRNLRLTVGQETLCDNELLRAVKRLFLTGKAADHQKFFFAKCPGVGINRLLNQRFMDVKRLF